MLTLSAVHGWGMHRQIWGDVFDGVAERFPVNAIDLPGHGSRSRNERMLTIDDVAASLDLPKGVWLGWSFGGQLVLREALTRPADCRALLLVCSTPCFVVRPDWEFGMPEATFEQFTAGLEEDHAATLERFAALEVFGSDTQRRDLIAIRQRLHAFPPPGRRTLRDGLALLKSTDLRTSLAAIDTPTLWIAGRRDRLTPPSAARWAAGQMPDARFVEMAGCGHAPFLGHPRRFAAEVESFLSEQNL